MPPQQKFDDDSRRVDEQSLATRQPPAVGRIRVESRIKDHESDADSAHAAAEVNRRKRMSRFMNKLQKQNRHEVFCQPRPRERVEKRRPDIPEVTDHE